MIEKICPRCKKVFEQQHGRQIYCTRECHGIWQQAKTWAKKLEKRIKQCEYNIIAKEKLIIETKLVIAESKDNKIRNRLFTNLRNRESHLYKLIRKLDGLNDRLQHYEKTMGKEQND